MSKMYLGVLSMEVDRYKMTKEKMNGLQMQMAMNRVNSELTRNKGEWKKKTHCIDPK